MKFKKFHFIILIFLFLFAGIQLKSVSSYEETTQPSFGMQIHDFEELSYAQEADNYWLRYNGLLWSTYQPNDSDEFIRNPALETKIEATNQPGLELILVIRSTPAWAQKYPGYYCGPMGENFMKDFADFMYDVVDLYSKPPYNVMYYELWNEPDEYWGNVYSPSAEFGCWGEPEDPYFGGGYYAEMLAEVYPAIKSANPNAQVILGGLLLPCEPGSHDNWDYCNMSKFVEGVLRNNGGDSLDYLNFHGYTSYDTTQPSAILMEKNEHWWDTAGGQVEGKLGYLQDLMASNGVSKPILLTEAGLADPYDNAIGDYAGFEQDKADYLVWLYARNLAKGIAGTTWYYLDGYGWESSGLLNENNDPLPAYEAFTILTSALKGASFNQELPSADGILGFEYSLGHKQIQLWFSEDGSLKRIPTPAQFLRAYDLYGNPVVPTDGSILFSRPLYVEIGSKIYLPLFIR